MFYRHRVVKVGPRFEQPKVSPTDVIAFIDLLTEEFGERFVPDEYHDDSQEAAERHVQGFLGFLHSQNVINFN